MKQTLRVGTRGSPLALAQSGKAVAALQALHPALKFETVVIRTEGDRLKTVEELRKAGKGVFVKEIERALLRREIDLAIHSLKDLPTELPEGLIVGAYLERAEAADAFIGRGTVGIDRLPPGSVVGTSSLRRQALLRQAIPQLDFEDLRGNLDTRLQKLLAPRSAYSGIVVAAAGVRRLLGEKAPPMQLLSKAVIVPAAGQGTLAIEVRKGDKVIREAIAAANHAPTEAASNAERELQRRLDGGCQLPLGIYAEVASDGLLKITAALSSVDGKKLIRETATGSLDDPDGVITALETLMRSQGADDILAKLPGRKAARKAPKKKPAAKKKSKARRR